MRLALLTGIHGRHDVAQACLERAADLVPERPIGLAVLSPEDREVMAPICAAAGWLWTQAPNQPLSHKWQTGLAALRFRIPDADAVMVLGSDDFFTPGFLQAGREALAAGEIAVGPQAVWMLDRASGCLGLWKGEVGTGRFLARAALDAADWKLWTVPKRMGLDGLASDALAAAGIPIRPLGGDAYNGTTIVDLKEDANLHAWPTIPYVHVLDPGPSRDLLDHWAMPRLDALLEARP